MMIRRPMPGPMPVRPDPRSVGRPMPGPMPMMRPLGSFKKGGKVKKTGLYKLHKGERVTKLSSLVKA